LKLLQQNKDKISYEDLLYNSNSKAIKLLEKKIASIGFSQLASIQNNNLRLFDQHLHRVNWKTLSSNPHKIAVNLLKANPAKIDWDMLSSNNNNSALDMLAEQLDLIRSIGKSFHQTPVTKQLNC